MPDQTVTVTFDPNATPQFSFDNPSVTLTAAGKIILNRAGGSTWTFTGMTITNGAGQFGTPDVNPAGTSIQVSDACSLKGSYCYTVTVSNNGTSYTSPDPTIVNDPPQPMPKPVPKPPPPPPK
jgi:hypothetical protein